MGTGFVKETKQLRETEQVDVVVALTHLGTNATASVNAAELVTAGKVADVLQDAEILALIDLPN